MNLRGIEFGNVFCTSGARNFDGKGWWYHRFIPGLDWTGSTFVAKTTTVEPRHGNMPLREDGRTPRERKPECIKVYPWRGMALNAVGLSGPGLGAILFAGWWQALTEPFMISLMAVEQSLDARLKKMRAAVDLLHPWRDRFLSPFGIQVNFSCPNAGPHERAGLIAEVVKTLDILAPLDKPLIPKFNLLLDVKDALAISRHPHFDAMAITNTIAWKDLPAVGIEREKLFGTDVSPLAKFGGGGLSGAPLFPLVCQKVQALRAAGFTKPIIAEGGILSADDAAEALVSGATAFGLGSAAFLRGWRVRSIIQHVKRDVPPLAFRQFDCEPGLPAKGVER